MGGIGVENKILLILNTQNYEFNNEISEIRKPGNNQKISIINLSEKIDNSPLIYANSATKIIL
jgi:hypothetical protein